MVISLPSMHIGDSSLARFFVSTPLGYEQSALEEMKQCWNLLLGKDAKPQQMPFPEVQIFSGGFEFEAELFTAVQLNFFLKTANRILFRMASFKTKDLPKFYQKFKSLPWIEYLPHGHVEWEVAAQKSRLNNEKRLQESAEKALQEIFANAAAAAADAEPCARIFIRMEDDQCTVSLDTTGEHLHKRGWSILKGEAPLRETIAVFLLKTLIGTATDEQLAQIHLYDPMMGSGTFLTEARTLRSPQFARAFAFQKWKKAPKLFLSSSFALNYALPNSLLFKSFLGTDLNEKMILAAEQNFTEVEKQLHAYERKNFVKADVKIWQQNSLQGEPLPQQPLWMIVNPPYGERLANDELGGITALAQGFCAKYTPEKLGILFPEKSPLKAAPKGYRIEKEVKINNGGLRCLFTLLTRL